jgi:hypothetical protein
MKMRLVTACKEFCGQIHSGNSKISSARAGKSCSERAVMSPVPRPQRDAFGLELEENLFAGAKTLRRG